MTHLTYLTKREAQTATHFIRIYDPDTRVTCYAPAGMNYRLAKAMQDQVALDTARNGGFLIDYNRYAKRYELTQPKTRQVLYISIDAPGGKPDGCHTDTERSEIGDLLPAVCGAGSAATPLD